jgi:hypothetical protein
MQIALANGTWVPSNDPLMQNDTFTFGGVIEPLVNFPPAPPGDLIMAGKGTISQVMGDGTLVFSGTFTVVPEPMSMMFLGIGRVETPNYQSLGHQLREGRIFHAATFG